MAIDLQGMVQTGYALQVQGRTSEAVSLYRRVLLVVPTVGLVHSLMATATGRTADAARAVMIEPTKASARVTLANSLAAVGRMEPAREHYRLALRLEPANVAAANDWGNAEAHHPEGSEHRARRLYQRALCLDPTLPATWFNLGAVGIGPVADDLALLAYRRALVLSPMAGDARFNHASALTRRQRVAEARSAFQRVLVADPRWADAWPRYARLLDGEEPRAKIAGRALPAAPLSARLHLYRADGYRLSGLHESAARAYRRSLVLDPGNGGVVYGRYASTSRALGRLDEIDRNHERAATSDPLAALSHWHAANILFQALRLGPAREKFRRALVIGPAMSGCWQNLGTTLNRFADIEATEAAYQRAVISAENDGPIVRSSLLMAAQYRPGVTAEALYREHRRWTAETFGSEERLDAWVPARAPARAPAGVLAGVLAGATIRAPIRVGFLSPDLGQHPVGFFLQAFMEHLDRDRITTHLLSTHTRQDPIAAWLKTHADTWRDLSDVVEIEPLLATVRAEEFDVLVDCAGHSARNTIPVFARRAAPVQITWGGYVGTTGLDAMDWLLTDRFQTAPGTEKSYAERWLVLPNDYICYIPSTSAPEVRTLSALQNRVITFGSFNNTAKINADVLDLWGRLLSRVVGSRLLLSYNGLDDPSLRASIMAPLARHGVTSDRVHFRVARDHRDYLDGYNLVDIGLDTFPYSGGLTTCEALWMGVPVVTMPGETFASRHSLSHLSNAGVTDTIASDSDEYLRLAIQLASDIEGLAERRRSLRGRVAASPLCDGRAYAEAFTAAVEHAVAESGQV